MNINIHDCGKKYHQKWVFRGIDCTFTPGQRYAITGNNGTGKSTLLKIIAGYTKLTAGTVTWHLQGKTILPENLFKYLSIATPYMESIEEFTFPELIRFIQQLQPFQKDFTEYDILHIAQLEKSKNTAVKFFSSGMKQKVLLSLAILSTTPLLLLDEPCSNLDADARKWYNQTLDKYGTGRTIIIASNHNPEEYPDSQNAVNL